MQKFLNGVNYWASHAGIDMWHEWKPTVIEEDLQKLSSLGMDTLRVFPLWPDFQPITSLLAYGGVLQEITRGEEFLDNRTEEDLAGVDVEMMQRFETFCSLAKKYGFKLIVGLITGWMSGRMYFPPAFVGKNVITDPLCVKWETRFIKYFVKRFKNTDCILAWELGNECNCLQKGCNEFETYNWTQSITDAIRSVDSSRPVYSGMHTLTGSTEAWKLTEQAELCDTLTIHPYPLFTPNCALDALVSPRCILHSPAEATLYADIGGCDCLVEEIGNLGPTMGGQESYAQFVRANLWNAWAHNTSGILWWMGFDCATKNLSKAPYDWCEVERQLGLIDVNGQNKKAALEYAKVVEFWKSFAYKQLPQRNRHAVCLLDPNNWNAAFGSFMLAKRTGMDLLYANKNERIKDEANLYILPSEMYSNFIRNHIYEQLMEKVFNGATLLITYDGQMIVPFEDVIGCSVVARRKVSNVKFVMDGETLQIKRDFMLQLMPITAEVVVSDEEGYPILTKNKYGKGKVIFFNAPIERFYAETPEIASKKDGYEKIYAYAKKCAGIEEVVEKKNPLTAITVHKIDEKKALVVALNNMQENLQEQFILCDARITKGYYGNIDTTTCKSVILPADAVVFEVEKL